MIVYAVTALAYLLYLVRGWLLGTHLRLQGGDLWILRGGLALIGLAACLVFLWFYINTQKQKKAGQGGSTPKDNLEMDAVIRQAEAQLKSSKLGRDATLRNLPVVFLVGDTGSGKTSTMVHSGLEPELVGGQVYGDDKVVPVSTRSANIWYKKNTVFVETAGRAITATGLWSGLLRRIRPGQFGSLKRDQQARAAVVCFSCEGFLQSGSTEGVTAAGRQIRTCLEEVAQTLGISFPVYVLFTKADRISFFTEYTRNLSNEEVAQVLGVTLPLRAGGDSGVYAEEATRRLNATFNNLLLSLADKRPHLLAREHDSQKLGTIYEFPRELRKLRSVLVQFLVEVCKPSQLRATPFLRGFYFSGIRAVFVNEVTRATPAGAEPGPAAHGSMDATGMFRSQGAAGRAPIP